MPRSAMLVITLAVCAVLVLLVPVLAVWADDRPDSMTEHTQQDVPRDEDPDVMTVAA